MLRKLVGFELDGRRVARHAMVVEQAGRAVGMVTSGSFSPSLQKPIGLGYVETGLAAPDTALEALADPARLPLRVTRPPFWKHGSRKT